MKPANLTIHQLHQHYRNGDFTPAQLIEHCIEQAMQLMDYNAWIELMDMQRIRPYLDQLQNRSIDELPLYGIPFAIKDNIDLAGLPTTAACEAFTYTPEQSAFVVEQLIGAGAIPLGKLNLDQFATGLVGTRSPWGPGKNTFNPDYISGGSSSGSAIVVAQGLVSFALGTDTAGSGRVPAAFNNIIGMKPSRGLLSNHGVVPACQSLDCIALFATTTDDLQTLFDISAQFDAQDPYARHNPAANHKPVHARPAFCFAVPREQDLEFFGNTAYSQLFDDTVTELEKLGGEKLEIDFTSFLDAARLLYEGPWVTERYLATQPLIDESPDALLDVTRGIISQGRDKAATDVFSSQYRLMACKQMTDVIMAECDFLLTPTAGTIYTIDEVNNDPVQLNSNLGYYTNYMNLLDYASIAIPAGFTESGLPFGVTLVADAFNDRKLLAYADRLQQALQLKLGATDWPLPESRQIISADDSQINIVVCGAHMSGLPLNHQLTERNATFIRQCQSSDHYRLVALPGGPPQRPGMIRVNEGGMAIEVEVWRMPAEHFGSFLAAIPHPLGLGKVELEDGSWETGFICEAYQAEQATDITDFGGWRAYIEQA